MTAMTFEDATIEVDTVPPLEDVEYPCTVCGKEAGPYSGRGPKPKKCPDHRSTRTPRTGAPKVSGSAANLAAQAAGVLVQINGVITIGMMAVGMRETASAMGACSDVFEQQAYAALLTDPDLCKLILRGGVQSSKVSLALAYVGMGTVVVPTAVTEMRAKREERRVRMEEAQETQEG